MANDLVTTTILPESQELQRQNFMPLLTTDQATNRYKTLVTFVKQVMREDIDFGKIPGTQKATLLKAGAEKLATMFGFRVMFVPVTVTEDWRGKNNDGEPFFHYHYKCQLWRGETLIAEADGSCNSYESRYRWRWVQESDLPPDIDKTRLAKRGGKISEFNFAIEQAHTTGQYGKPAEYWQRFKDAIENGTAVAIKKKTRKGGEMDAWEINSTVYRIPNEDIPSQANTMMKIAQKRALVAAILIGCNASEFFTQDVEDMDDHPDRSYGRAPAYDDYYDAPPIDDAKNEQPATTRPNNPATKPPATGPDTKSKSTETKDAVIKALSNCTTIDQVDQQSKLVNGSLRKMLTREDTRELSAAFQKRRADIKAGLTQKESSPADTDQSSPDLPPSDTNGNGGHNDEDIPY